MSSGEYGEGFVDKMVKTVEKKFPLQPIEKKKNPYNNYEFLKQKKMKASWKLQFITLFKRMMLQHYRDRVSL